MTCFIPCLFNNILANSILNCWKVNYSFCVFYSELWHYNWISDGERDVNCWRQSNKCEQYLWDGGACRADLEGVRGTAVTLQYLLYFRTWDCASVCCVFTARVCVHHSRTLAMNSISLVLTAVADPGFPRGGANLLLNQFCLKTA